MRWISMFFAILLAIITITMSYPRPEIQHQVPQIDNSSIVGSGIPKLPNTLLDNRDNNSALIDSDKDMFNDLQVVLLDEPVKFTKVKYRDGTEERLEATEGPLDDTKLMWETYNDTLRKIYGDLENYEDKNILMTNDAAANRFMDYFNKIYEKLQSQHEKSENGMEDSQWRQKQVSDMSHFLKLTIGNKTLDEMKKAAIILNVEQLALNYYDIKNIITNNTVDSTQNLTFTDKVVNLQAVNKNKKTKKTRGNLRKQNKAAAREDASSKIKTNQELQMNDNGALSRETLKKYEYDTFDPTLVVVDVNKDSEMAPGDNDAKQNTNENKKPKFVYKKGNVPPFNPSIWTQMAVESAKKHVSK